jgi:hypothetical protein
LSVSIISCSVEKRLYNKGYSVEWKHGIKGDSKNAEVLNSEISEAENDLAVLESDLVLETEQVVTIETNDEPVCDTLKLKNGETKLGIVQEIGISEIKYKNCDGVGPVYVVEKSSVKSIRYSNGKEELIQASSPATEVKPAVKDTRKVEGFGIAGFVSSIIGLFFAGIPLGIVAIVFGIVSIGRSVSHPSKYKAKAFGVISLILGLVVLIATLILVL